jgi:hypothetical protein
MLWMLHWLKLPLKLQLRLLRRRRGVGANKHERLRRRRGGGGAEEGRELRLTRVRLQLQLLLRGHCSGSSRAGPRPLVEKRKAVAVQRTAHAIFALKRRSFAFPNSES